jgi:hypothetical protein
MKRLSVIFCLLVLVVTANAASARRRPRLLPAQASHATDTRALWMQAPGRVDTVFRHDSTRVRRDSAMVDSTVRDTLRRPKPTPPPQRPRPRPRTRTRVVYLG